MPLPERSELTPMQNYFIGTAAKAVSIHVTGICCYHQWQQQPLTGSEKCATCGALAKRDAVSGRIVEYTSRIPVYGG